MRSGPTFSHNPDFTLPSAGNSASLIVEEFAGFTGAVFQDSDIIELRQISRIGGGLTVASAWGTVVYVSRDGSANPSTQTYTFTRSVTYPGTGSGTINKGTLALNAFIQFFNINIFFHKTF